MESKVNQYCTENDIIVESVFTEELLILNPRITPVKTGNVYSVELGILFRAVDPVPENEKVINTVNPEYPMFISFRSHNEVDHLIATLQKLRAQIWGLDLNNSNN